MQRGANIILQILSYMQRGATLPPILFFSFRLMGFPEIVAFVDPVQELEDTK